VKFWQLLSGNMQFAISYFAISTRLGWQKEEEVVAALSELSSCTLCNLTG
jgi:hypothetical protein